MGCLHDCGLAHDHNHVLIPSGGRVVGNFHPVGNTGQQHLTGRVRKYWPQFWLQISSLDLGRTSLRAFT